MQLTPISYYWEQTKPILTNFSKFPALSGETAANFFPTPKTNSPSSLSPLWFSELPFCPRDCAKRNSMGCAGSSEAKGEGEFMATYPQKINSFLFVRFAVVLVWLYQFISVCFLISSISSNLILHCLLFRSYSFGPVHTELWDLIEPRKVMWLVSQINLSDACKLAWTPRLLGKKYLCLYVLLVVAQSLPALIGPLLCRFVQWLIEVRISWFVIMLTIREKCVYCYLLVLNNSHHTFMISFEYKWDMVICWYKP